VWIAAVDAADTFCGRSRAFIAGAVRRGAQLVIPSFAVTEVACALARKHRNTAVARRLTGSLLTPVGSPAQRYQPARKARACAAR
jgi:hypothetical protein